MELFDYLLQGIISIVVWFVQLLYHLVSLVLLGMWIVLKFGLWLIVAGILSTVSGFIAGISLSSVAFNFAGQWAGLPPQAIYIVNALGIPEFMTIIAGAYLIRFTLNLIPGVFTRV